MVPRSKSERDPEKGTEKDKRLPCHNVKRKTCLLDCSPTLTLLVNSRRLKLNQICLLLQLSHGFNLWVMIWLKSYFLSHKHLTEWSCTLRMNLVSGLSCKTTTSKDPLAQVTSAKNIISLSELFTQTFW